MQTNKKNLVRCEVAYEGQKKKIYNHYFLTFTEALDFFHLEKKTISTYLNQSLKMDLYGDSGSLIATFKIKISSY